MQEIVGSQRGRLAIWESVKVSYRLAAESISGLSIATVILVIAQLLIALVRPPPPLVLSTTGLVVSTVCNVLAAIVMAPYAVLIHRRILLQEESRNYVIAAASRRTMHFAGVAVGLAVFAAIGSFLQNGTIGIPWEGAIGFLWTVASILVTIRLSLAFPAIATDAPENPIADSWRATAGSFWRIFWAMLVAVIPIMVIAVILYRIPSAIVAGLGQAILATFSTALYVAFASHLFRTRSYWCRAAR
jgi:hypothetical protein